MLSVPREVGHGDHVLACGDHVLACGDHVLACGDHVLACGDHVLACGDHVLAFPVLPHDVFRCVCSQFLSSAG